MRNVRISRIRWDRDTVGDSGGQIGNQRTFNWDHDLSPWMTLNHPSSRSLQLQSNISIICMECITQQHWAYTRSRTYFVCAKFWSIYCETCISEYSKWLPVISLECTKFVFGRALPGHCWGSLQRSPRPLSWLAGATGRVSDLRSRGHGFDSRPARGVKTLGKFLTPVCLCSPSSTSWYRPKGGDALRLGSKSRYGLCVSGR